MSENASVLKVNGRCRVREQTENGPHPHGGKTGRILEILGVWLAGPGNPPRAMVKLDDGTGIAVVSLKYLEPQP